MFLVGNWVSSSLSFFLSASTAATYIFTAPTCTIIIIVLEPCALNAETQHFIPRFNRISLLCEPHSKRGDRGGERRTKDKVSLQKTLLSKAIRRSKLVPHEEKWSQKPPTFKWVRSDEETCDTHVSKGDLEWSLRRLVTHMLQKETSSGASYVLLSKWKFDDTTKEKKHSSSPLEYLYLHIDVELERIFCLKAWRWGNTYTLIKP